MANLEILPHTSFRDWAVKKFNEGVLNALLGQIVKTGKASGASEALQFLSENLGGRTLEKKSFITLTDLGLRSDKKRWTDFSNTPDGANKGLRTSCRSLGLLSHQLMAQLCRKQRPSLFTGNVQPFLFECRPGKAEQLAFKYGDLSGEEENTSIRTLKNIWTEASQNLENSQDFFDDYTRSIKYLVPLREALEKTVGFSLSSVLYEPRIGPAEKWLQFISLLTWAKMFFVFAKGHLPFPGIYELQVLDRNLGLSGGRVDGVEIISGNQSPASPNYYRLFGSIGQLANRLRQTGEGGSSLRIVEWKFAVGDSIRAEKIISPAEVATSPFLKHQHQVERYLTLGSLDEYLARGITPHQHIWEEETLVQEGWLIYFFPTIDPIVYKISLTPKQRQEVFIRDISSHWERAKHKALFRQFDSQCSSALSFKKNVQEPLPNREVRPQQMTNSLHHSLISSSDHHLSPPITAIIDSHRIFLDKNKTIENRSGRYILHLDHLLANIEAGKIKASSFFRLPEGGLICCPVHLEKNPSFSVRPQEGFFYCFSRRCKISGRISTNSIPPNFKKDLNLPQWLSRKDLFKDFAIPEEHHLLLLKTQEFLQEEFWGTEGERYVRQERKIDPDLAHAMGAGFGTPRVIAKLFDQDIPLKNLVEIGLVKFSLRVGPSRGLNGLLRSRGMVLEKIQKEVSKNSGKKIEGFPYFALEGRLTFPLKLGGKYTNLYGRATYPNAKVPHLKLCTRETGISHGAFNEEVLRSSQVNEIILVEGVFDAISLSQMFSSSALAIIGTNNQLITELVARSGKDVAIGLDNDHAGREDTRRLEKALYDSPRFKGKIRDFTQFFIEKTYGSEFKERYRGFLDWRDELGWDDWNTLLIKFGRWFS